MSVVLWWHVYHPIIWNLVTHIAFNSRFLTIEVCFIWASVSSTTFSFVAECSSHIGSVSLLQLMESSKRAANWNTIYFHLIFFYELLNVDECLIVDSNVQIYYLNVSAWLRPWHILYILSRLSSVLMFLKRLLTAADQLSRYSTFLKL
jgi:hypothetical protein